MRNGIAVALALAVFFSAMAVPFAMNDSSDAATQDVTINGIIVEKIRDTKIYGFAKVTTIPIFYCLNTKKALLFFRASQVNPPAKQKTQV